MEVFDTDVLVLGGGGAAARAAVEAARSGVTVTMAVKGKFGSCGSTATGKSEAMAISAAIGYGDPRDNPEVHFKDTVEVGQGLCDERLVRILVDEAPQRLFELVKLGAKFDVEGDKLKQRMSDAATYPRVCGSKGITGKIILDALTDELRRLDVNIVENAMVTKLLTRNSTVIGATVVDLKTGTLDVFRAKSVILATGGGGQVFLYNAFTPDMTGDGYALAYDAGAELVNMEFVQMGPALIHPYVRVISGSLWRLNPRVYNAGKEQFLGRYLPSGLTPEDLFKIKTFPFTTRTKAMYLDLAIYSEIKAGRGTEHGGVYFDVTHVPEDVVKSAPITFNDLLSRGLDMRKQPIEIGIAAQNFNGGVRINERTETSVTGLYVAGEVAGGVRGPDRPGGNALAECQVFGARAGKYAAERAKSVQLSEVDLKDVDKQRRELDGIVGRSGGLEPRSVAKKIQRVMWENVCVARNRMGLEHALGELQKIKRDMLLKVYASKTSLMEALSLRSLILTGEAVAAAALTREESRGNHYREDFPQRNDEKWLNNILLRKIGQKMVTEIVKPQRI